MKKNLKNKKSLNIAMLGHKRIPSREGGIEIVVEELATRMVTLGHKVTCYNRSGHHVSGKNFDGGKRKAYKGVRLRSVLTLDKKGLAAMTASVSGAICAAFGKYDVVHFHTEVEVKILGIIATLSKEDAMSAAEISAAVGCNIQKVAIWGSKVLAKKGLINIEKREARNYYYDKVD